MIRRDAPRPQALLVDWGTSKLRVWAWQGDDRVSEALTYPRGMKFLTPTEYSGVVAEIRDALGADADVPVLICGMAGARGGWREAAYLSAPVELSHLASNLLIFRHESSEIRIVPGVRLLTQRADVMRGEETQLFGLLQAGVRTRVCLPGTHCKWASLTQGRLDDFSTFMTGEIFEVLSKHSILSKTLGTDWDWDDFRAGVAEVVRSPEEVWRSLFGLRAGALLNEGPASDRARLSGLLIGAECSAARSAFDTGPVTLIADGEMAQAYRHALDVAGFEVALTDGETATRQGLVRLAQEVWKN